MRSGSMASGRMRFAMGLTVVGAVLLITGLLMVLVSEAMRLKSGHAASGFVHAGEFLACAGLAVGVALVIGLTSGKLDRGPADRGPADRRPAGWGSADRAPAAPARRIMRRGATGARARRDQAEEWLGPLRTAGGGLGPQRALPSWQAPAEEERPGSDDYADNGWNPDLDDGWSPGPAYVWAPGEEDGWDGDGQGDWDPDGEDWNQSADGTAWPAEDLWGPGATGPQQGYGTGPHVPVPGYLTGPQPVYTAGPEPGPAGGPEPAYLSDPDYAAAVAGEPDPGTARRDDDTSPIPVIREPAQPAPPPLPSETVAAPKPFSVWEPAPKPFSVWEPAPKPNLEPGPDGRPDDVYRPSHAEPPAPDTQEKIEQIKDLYVTAEAIGDDALDRHFDELHERQRSLIREFFEKAGLGPKDTPRLLGDDSAQDGAPLPG